jgi:hypothetical protein
MLRHLLSLLLLAVLSLGLGSGPHPCKAAHPEPESRGSCHEAAAASHGPAAHESAPSHGDGQDCCNTFCQHACHMSAIADAVQIAFAVTPVSQTIVEPAGSDPPRFAHPKHHVPLA